MFSLKGFFFLFFSMMVVFGKSGKELTWDVVLMMKPTHLGCSSDDETSHLCLFYYQIWEREIWWNNYVTSTITHAQRRYDQHLCIIKNSRKLYKENKRIKSYHESSYLRNLRANGIRRKEEIRRRNGMIEFWIEREGIWKFQKWKSGSRGERRWFQR